MVRLLLALALLASSQLGDLVGFDSPVPDLVGTATWYGEPVHLFEGNYTKGGDLWDPEAMACAVDINDWERYRGQELLVCSEARCIQVRVWDTGYLARAGVALDLTPRAFEMLGVLEDGVLQMRAFLLERE